MKLIKAVFTILTATLFLAPSCLAWTNPLGDYIIGAGDVLKIQVWSHDDLNRQVEVSQNGDISFPLIGRVHVQGMTAFEVEQLLTEKLSGRYLVGPQLTVDIVEFTNQEIYLYGAVDHPGSYSIKRYTSILDVITNMGGVNEKTGNRATVVRPASANRPMGPKSIEEAAPGELIDVDLAQLVAGNAEQMFFVKPGDTIYVSKSSRIFITGEVAKPGEYKWEKGLTVAKAISMAGGPSRAGAPNRTRIVRVDAGHQTEIKSSMDDEVMPDDIIKVPRAFF
jgi:polysaccharide export outer membrane protein